MLGRVYEQFCLSLTPVSLTTSRHLTWCRYKYYHHISSRRCDHATAGTGEQRSSIQGSSWVQKTAVRSHSTQNAQKWEAPQGYATPIRIHHPLVKEQVPLVLLQEKMAQWYVVCYLRFQLIKHFYLLAYLPSYLPTCVSTYLPIILNCIDFPPTKLHTYLLNLPTCLPPYQPIYLLTCIHSYLPVYQPTHPPIYLHDYPD